MGPSVSEVPQNEKLCLVVGRLSGGPPSEPLHTANACSNVQTLLWAHRPAYPIVSGNVPMLILSKKGRTGLCPLSIPRVLSSFLRSQLL